MELATHRKLLLRLLAGDDAVGVDTGRDSELFIGVESETGTGEKVKLCCEIYCSWLQESTMVVKLTSFG